LAREPRFNEALLADVLAIPSVKTLLRRHLSIHFREVVGREVVRAKRHAEADRAAPQLTLQAKAKLPRQPSGFTLKRKKSKSALAVLDGELLCPPEERRRSDHH